VPASRPQALARAAPAALRRKPKKAAAAPPAPSIGTKYTHPPGAKSTLASPVAEVDGRNFTLKDGAKVLMTTAAQSGKPITVQPAHATACKGAPTDSYLNNPLYVGIKDFGAIPEGEYKTNLSNFATFSTFEQARMTLGGSYTDPFGKPLHGGDWGAGRGPLTPTKLLPATCGNTAKRSGFYLHGGNLAGSSGCIDVGNSGLSSFLTLMAGYTANLKVKVKYLHPAPAVGSGTRALGRFTYPTQGGKPVENPGLLDRVKSVFEGD
jgi:hypothetical protein